MKRYEKMPLNDDSVLDFVRSAKLLDTKVPLTWMGGYVVSCKVNGNIRKVDISNYAGYFYDEESGKYYQIPEDKIEEWLDFLRSSYLALMKRATK